jgi:hypothetical protein
MWLLQRPDPQTCGPWSVCQNRGRAHGIGQARKPNLDAKGNALIGVGHWARFGKIRVFLVSDLKSCSSNRVVNLAIQVQPPPIPFQTGVRRSCHRLILSSDERRCSTKIRRPVCFNTRFICWSAASGFGMEQSDHIITKSRVDDGSLLGSERWFHVFLLSHQRRSATADQTASTNPKGQAP